MEDFHKCSSHRDGLAYYCKACKGVKESEYRLTNREKMKEYLKEYQIKNRDRLKEQQRIRYLRNRAARLAASKRRSIEKKEEIAEFQKNYRAEHLEELRAKQREYFQKTKHLRHSKVKERCGKDPKFALITKIRSNIKQALRRRGVKKSTFTESILGCGFKEFYTYQNALFMNKYSTSLAGYTGKVEIHHIISLETAKSEEDVIKLNYYTNLIVLTKEDHRAIHFGRAS